MSDLYKEADDIDFEIRFLEGLLKHQPDFIEALIALGDDYTQKGLYDKGLRVDEKLAALLPEDPVAHYNLACSYSLVGEINKAFRSIKKAARLGYHNLKHLEHDKDLANLRQDRRFQEYYERLKKNLSAAVPETVSCEEKIREES